MKNIIILITLHITVTANAQQFWTFDSCLNYALKYNLDIQQSCYNQQISSINYRQSGLNILPTVSSYVNHNINNGRSINQADNTYVNQGYQSGTMGLNLNFNIFNGFTDYYAIAKSKYANKATQANFEILKLELSFKILEAYLKVLYCNEFQKICYQQAQLSQQQSNYVETLYNMGKNSLPNVLEMKAALALNNEIALNAANKTIIAQLQLVQLINYSNTQTLMLDSALNWQPDSTLLLTNPSQLYLQTFNNTAYISNAQYQLKIAESQLAQTRGKLLPTFMVGASVGSGYSGLAVNPRINNMNTQNNYSYNQQISDNINNQIYFSINIPIFDRFSRLSDIGIAKVNKLQAQNHLNIAQQTLNNQLQILFADYKNAWAHYHSKTITYNSISQLYNNANQRFKMGVLNALEFRLSQVNYNIAQTELLQSKYELLLKQQMLKLYMGSL